MSEKKIPYKIYLSEDEIPKAWYNMRADMKNKPAPLLNPGTGKPLTAEELSPIFCDELIRQDLSKAVCGDLEKHAYSINDGISDPELRNMHILSAV